MMFSKLFASVVIFSGCVYSHHQEFLNNSNIWNDVRNNSINKGSSIIHLNDLKNALERKTCGESLKHVAGLVLDKKDKEAKLIVEGSIRANKLILKLGCIKEKEIYIKNILLPIETISSKCINIRQKIQEDNTILCLENKFMRNFWINSITDAVLCNETKVVGKLPQYKYSQEKINEENKQIINENNQEIENEKVIDEDNKEITSEDTKEIIDNEITTEIENQNNIQIENENNKEMKIENDNDNVIDENNKEIIDNGNNNDSKDIINEEWKQNILNEEFEDEIEKNEEQKGLKLRIAKSKYGYPKVKINGTDINQFKNNKNGELRSTNDEDNENATNIENNDTEKTDEFITE